MWRQYLAKEKPNNYSTGIPLYNVDTPARVPLPKAQKFFEREEVQNS